MERNSRSTVQTSSTIGSSRPKFEARRPKSESKASIRTGFFGLRVSAFLRVSDLGLRPSCMSLPPKHSLEPSPVGIGTRDPICRQLQMRRIARHQLFARGPEWRAISIGDQVVDREVLPIRLQPTQDCGVVFVALVWSNRAEQGMLEDPIK